MLKFILIILDGFGLRKESEANAIAQAQTPHLDRMMMSSPLSKIETSGKFVGLPDGVMGNSEVGHKSMGAGRIIKQDLVRINDSIKSNELQNNFNLQACFKHVKNNNSTLHILGLLSDGGVHSQIDHLDYILQFARESKITKIALHPITDGRDTSPKSGIGFIKHLQSKIDNDSEYKISTVSGRYYGMDRDSRWDRIEKAYNMLVYGDGDHYSDPISAINASYDRGVNDEFILPCIIGDVNPIKDGDAVLTMNFRSDRMRQIIRSLKDPSFSHFNTKSLDILLTCMTKYQEDFPHPTLFKPEKIENIFPEILSQNKYRQLRIAETEKYAHVTYFFNGGSEESFPGESRLLIPSPKVDTYDMKPEMSAFEVTDNVVKAISEEKYEAIIMNYANPDMVGHTGNIEAAIKAIEAIDLCIGRIIEAVDGKNTAIFLTADHGNLELMVDPETGEMHTAHTTLPVPLILEGVDDSYKLKDQGKLADIAPTILDFLNIPIPKEMNGSSLLIRADE